MMKQDLSQPLIDAYHYSPIKGFATTDHLLLLPILLLSGAALIIFARRNGHGQKVWQSLVVTSAILIACTAIIPVSHYLCALVTDDYQVNIAARTRWFPIAVWWPLAWMLPLSYCVLLGIKSQQRLAAVASCGLATFYLVFPLAFTLIRGTGLMGPGYEEIVLISTSILLAAEFSKDNSEKTIVILKTVVAAAVFSAIGAATWFALTNSARSNFIF
jgi:hypothetical protein